MRFCFFEFACLLCLGVVVFDFTFFKGNRVWVGVWDSEETVFFFTWLNWFWLGWFVFFFGTRSGNGTSRAIDWCFVFDWI